MGAGFFFHFSIYRSLFRAKSYLTYIIIVVVAIIVFKLDLKHKKTKTVPSTRDDLYPILSTVPRQKNTITTMNSCRALRSRRVKHRRATFTVKKKIVVIRPEKNIILHYGSFKNGNGIFTRFVWRTIFIIIVLSPHLAVLLSVFF